MVRDETLAQQEFDPAEIAISVPGDSQWVEIVHVFVQLNKRCRHFRYLKRQGIALLRVDGLGLFPDLDFRPMSGLRRCFLTRLGLCTGLSVGGVSATGGVSAGAARGAVSG